jgi:CheY-like chemotaxis protein
MCGAALLVPKSSTYDIVAQVVSSQVVSAEVVSAEADSPKPEPAPAADVRESKPVPTPAVVEPLPWLIPPKAEPPKARILLADSSKMDREETADILRKHNYAVLEVADGALALDMIRKERPDAAVLNVKLEGMSGFQVLHQMRSMANVLNKDVWNMPVLMTTERLHGRDKQYAISLGVEGYFVKPVPAARFAARLEKIIVRHPTP